MKTVSIGKQVWMAENLNVETFRNGDLIPQAATDREWKEAWKKGQPAWCYYNNDIDYGDKYGRLYNWFAVTDPRGLAPEGWHIPDDEEWEELVVCRGGKLMAAQSLKSREGWKMTQVRECMGTDETGFAALPGGCRFASGPFANVDNFFFAWSTSKSHMDLAWHREMASRSCMVMRLESSRGDGFSVRCLKGEPWVKNLGPADLSWKYVAEDHSYHGPEVIIGSQIWMLHNLSVARFSNGDMIPQAVTDEEWINACQLGQPVWCYPANDTANGAKFGKLYNQHALTDPRGLAPKGWRVSTEKDWDELVQMLRAREDAGKLLKSRTGWKDLEGTDEVGFRGLPGGMRNRNGQFDELGNSAFFWCMTDNTSAVHGYRHLDAEEALIAGTAHINNGFSVRCVSAVPHTNLQSNIFTSLAEVLSHKSDSDAGIIIGGQTWMRRNLNVDRFRNGDLIPQAQTAEDWMQAAKHGLPAWCHYRQDAAMDIRYGKLYNWHAVNDPRGLAPEGWHVPSDKEWQELEDYLCAEDEEGILLKSRFDWDDYLWMKGNGTDILGFEALPGGFISPYGDSVGLGGIGSWWSATEYGSKHAWERSMESSKSYISRQDLSKSVGLSVRCVKDMLLI